MCITVNAQGTVSRKSSVPHPLHVYDHTHTLISCLHGCINTSKNVTVNKLSHKATKLGEETQNAVHEDWTYAGDWVALSTHLAGDDCGSGSEGSDDKGNGPQEEEQATQHQGQPEHRWRAPALTLPHQQHLVSTLLDGTTMYLQRTLHVMQTYSALVI